MHQYTKHLRSFVEDLACVSRCFRRHCFPSGSRLIQRNPRVEIRVQWIESVDSLKNSRGNQMYVVECEAQRVPNTKEKRGKLQDERRSKDKCANLSFSILRRFIQTEGRTGSCPLVPFAVYALAVDGPAWRWTANLDLSSNASTSDSQRPRPERLSNRACENVRSRLNCIEFNEFPWIFSSKVPLVSLEAPLQGGSSHPRSAVLNSKFPTTDALPLDLELSRFLKTKAKSVNSRRNSRRPIPPA